MLFTRHQRDGQVTFHEVLPGSCPRIARWTRFCRHPPCLKEHKQLVSGILGSLATISSLRVGPRCECTQSTGGLHAEEVASAAQPNGSPLEVHEEFLSGLRRISGRVFHTYLSAMTRKQATDLRVVYLEDQSPQSSQQRKAQLSPPDIHAISCSCGCPRNQQRP